LSNARAQRQSRASSISRQSRGPRARHEEPESIGQPTDHIERETDSERILDLLARCAGSEDYSYVIRKLLMFCEYAPDVKLVLSA
jgi:hypothetical protein